MNSRHQVAAFLAGLLGVAGAYLIYRASSPRAGRDHTGAASTATKSVPALPGRVVAAKQNRGEELARTYCSTCHLYPDPQLLTKTEWADHVLPQMAERLGVTTVNYEKMRDGKLLQAAKIYPDTPMISRPDWAALCDYYVAAAPGEPLPPQLRPKARVGLDLFRAKKINLGAGVPMTTLVKIDEPRKQLYIGDAYAGNLAILNPADNRFKTVRLGNPAVRLTVTDSGFYATLIGQVFPSDAPSGALMFLPKDQGSPQLILNVLRRPTDVAVADLNQDGRDDFVVCSFGNELGSFSWFENTGRGGFREHILLDRPGAVRCEIDDFNHDGRPDIIVLTAQAREGIYIFYNQGQGRFALETVVEQPPAFGYVDLELADFNRDGHLDLVAVNGDNGDNPTPHKRYHGVRLYLNDGRNHFKEAWFYPLEGAYKAAVADFDQDGDLDLAVISFYPDFTQPTPESFVYLENKGNLEFEPYIMTESGAGRWLVMDAGDLDGDGDTDLVLGSFVPGPTTVPVPASVHDQWKTNGAAVLILENRLR